MSQATMTLPDPRRHDLDALRAGAMLLGIVLHAGMSFIPITWMVQDTRQSGAYGLIFFFLHGFRMPLFFVMSGFFTAMLWRRRGLASLLWHRFRRVLIPCLLGLVTVVPLVGWVSAAAMGVPGHGLFGNLALDTSSTEALLHGLFAADRFHHLWFLWFLCWMFAGFAVYAAVMDWAGWRGLPRWLVVGPARYAWLIPLTLLPMLLMYTPRNGFGPDTSTGYLPLPHIFAYYAVFFSFGVFYYDADDREGRVSRWWAVTLPLALAAFVVGLTFTRSLLGYRSSMALPWLNFPVAALLQVCFAWFMIFGLMGLTRRFLSVERPWVRYISDSSYWLYLAHLPLVIALQWWVRDWPYPAVLKFSFICLVTTVSLLFTYATLVRYTWLGTMLNGPRKRPARREKTERAEPAEAGPALKPAEQEAGSAD